MRQIKCHKQYPRDNAMEPKEEVVPFLGIAKEGFAKEVTFKMDLEKMNMSSQDGG